jgi:hypothetical protein
MKICEKGNKYDSDKVMLGLLISEFSDALYEVGLVHTHGYKKYGANNWGKVKKGKMRYTDALYRHLNSEHKGEATDPDSGCLHAAHTAWNALVRLQLMLNKKNA